MNLVIIDNTLQIHLNFLEQLNANTFQKMIEVPLAHIRRVTTEKPQYGIVVKTLGSYIPGIFKTGKYFSESGEEFWYATRSKDYLVLDLKDDPFTRIVLTIEDNENWQAKISQSLGA